MKTKSEALNEMKRFAEIVKKSNGREEFLVMYSVGECIKSNLNSFDVKEVSDKKTRYSNCYLHLIKDGKEYILSEEVAQAFYATIRFSKNHGIDFSNSAEIVLGLYISLYKYLELTVSKEWVHEGLKIAVNKYIESADDADIFVYTIKATALEVGNEVNGLKSAVDSYVDFEVNERSNIDTKVTV